MGFLGGIYRIINIANSKYYIGSAINLANRKRQHFSELSLNKHTNKHLQNAYNLYGENSFLFDVIEFCENDFLIEREQFWIDAYKREGCPLYNLCSIAGSRLGTRVSEVSKKKISLSKKGVPAHNKGKIMSDEQKEKISKALTGRERPIADVIKTANSNKGKKRTEEFKKRMSEIQKRLGSKPPSRLGKTKTNRKVL